MSHLESFPAHIRRWSIDDYDRLMEIGLIAMRSYELIDGIIYNTSGFPRRWSLGDYGRMAEAGLLSWEEHAELVEGFVVTLPRALGLQTYIRCVALNYLYGVLDNPVLFSGAGHCIVFDDENLACPDLSMLKWRDDYYRDAWPRAGDVFAIMEVSAEPLVAGSEMRIRQFARFAVPEFWHADGTRDVITIHRTPVEAVYTDVRTYRHGESFVSDAVGGLTIPVDELIGPERPEDGD